MIEPTETEPIENLQDYALTLNNIAEMSHKDKDQVLRAPTATSIGRLDEYKASHPNTMVLNWRDLNSGTGQKKS